MAVLDAYDVSIREWKSPWLDSNKPFWHAQVGEAATEMISVWLKKRTIRDFFELLQADGQADRQRMEFWLQYAEQIDDIWLALGDHSLYNNKPDYKRIRQNMMGRYMALTGGSYTQDNAFLMRIGGFVFIEFGKQNNACHVFSADNLPFQFGQKAVLGTQDGLKNTAHPGHQRKLMHRDGWQWEFANFIRSNVNVGTNNIQTIFEGMEPSYPHNSSSGYLDGKTIMRLRNTVNKKKPDDDLVDSKNSVSVKPSTFGQIKKQTQTQTNYSNKSVNMEQLKKFCKAFGFQIDDRRSIGGALWVNAPESHPVASYKLMSFGFTYKEGKGWWLE